MGYTGVRKGSYFKLLWAPSHVKQNIALSILTPFSSKIGQKNEKGPPKQLNWMRVKGGLEIVIYVIFLSFVPFLTSGVAGIYVFEVKKSIFQGFEKIGPLFFQKNVYIILSCEGAFVDAGITF